jgi:tRNA pseudouridine38-40 synthase
MRNLRLLIAYDGTDFHGWQRQPNAPTIQGLLEESIAKIVREPVTLQGSGRTDAGVHATGQVGNLLTSCRIPCRNLLKALNDALPPTVRIRRVDEVAEDFHARYSARSKTYRYRIYQRDVCPPFLCRFVNHHPEPLDSATMAQAASLLEGEHDFTSFAATEREEDQHSLRLGSNIRRIDRSRVLTHPRLHLIVYEVESSGFLRHMARNIVGTLLQVGCGKLSPQDAVRILGARDRSLAGPTAPAQGLCLMKVVYD